MRTFVCCALLCLLTVHPLLGQAADHIVISEVYGGGGNSGSIWKNDFVELYNPTSTPVVMTNWSLQYQAYSTQGVFQTKAIFSGTIASRGFFLIQLAQGNGGTTPLPTPDANPPSPTINLSAERAKVALVSDTLNITNATDPNVVDFVGYGTSANKFEGTGPAPAPSNTTSIERKASATSTKETMGPGGAEEKAGNGYDSNDNAKDFVFQSTINPQNSASPKEPAASILAGIGSAEIRPAVLKADTAVALTFVVRGNSAGTVTSIKIPHQWPFEWSKASTDVTVYGGARGIVAAGADTLIVKALALGASDSVVVAVSKLSALDTTISVTFRIETGAGSDSTALISPLPKLLLYGSPHPIAEMRVNDVTGVPIHLQKLVTVRGFVTVSNQFGSPAFIQDASGGIAVFDNAFVNAVRVSDEVSITGMVTQFNGLTELENVTLHHVHSSGNEILPTVVTASQIADDGVNGVELYEGMLVRLGGIVVRDTLGQQISVWSSAGSGSNFLLIDGTDTITVRIDADTQIAGLSAPQGAFDIIGIVGQFSRGPVFTGGYQLQPRSRSDILSKGPFISSTPLESSITPTSLKISWETASAGSSFVRYGRTKSYELGIAGAASMATSHSVTMTSLEPATVYNVQAFSVNGTDTSLSGNRVVSTSSQGSSGEFNVYFNKSVNTALARSDAAKGNVNLPDRLLQRINNAQISIDGALYSMSGSVGDTIANAVVRAKNRGVKVRLIIEKDNLSAGTGNTITQIIAAAGIPWIADNFDGVNGGVGLHHNKFFVFDYQGGTPEKIWVWTGSWNLTDPGTLEDLQNAIEIQDQALAGAYTLEFNEMWGSDTDTPNASNSRFGARKFDNTPHIFNINGTPVELYFSPSDRTTSAIIRTLNRAQHSVNLALLTFTRSDIASALRAKKDAGVRVRAILDNNTDNGSQYSFLTGTGIEVRIDPNAGLLHHKYAVVDAELSSLQQYVITGSHNWTSAAENSNNENTLIIESNRIANQYLQEFAARYEESGGVDGITVSVEHVSAERTMNFWLSQNYPNPFNPKTAISFQLSANSSVALRVFDVLGREVAVLVNGEKPAGVYRVTWDAKNLPSGVYLYRLQAGAFVETRKTLLLR